MWDAYVPMLCYLTYILKMSFRTLRFWGFFSGGEVDFLSRRVMGACNQEIADQLSPLLNHIEFERDWNTQNLNYRSLHVEHVYVFISGGHYYRIFSGHVFIVSFIYLCITDCNKIQSMIQFQYILISLSSWIYYMYRNLLYTAIYKCMVLLFSLASRKQHSLSVITGKVKIMY